MPSLVIVIATWASGGNLPPLLALAGLLRAAGHCVLVLSQPELRALDDATERQDLSFANHEELFPQCDAVVTHGGLGTVLRALVHGVPLLLLPLGRDQRINAAHVVELGAGTHLAHEQPPRRSEWRAGTLWIRTPC